MDNDILSILHAIVYQKMKIFCFLNANMNEVKIRWKEIEPQS